MRPLTNAHYQNACAIRGKTFPRLPAGEASCLKVLCQRPKNSALVALDASVLALMYIGKVGPKIEALRE